MRYPKNCMKISLLTVVASSLISLSFANPVLPQLTNQSRILKLEQQIKNTPLETQKENEGLITQKTKEEETRDSLSEELKLALNAQDSVKTNELNDNINKHKKNIVNIQNKIETLGYQKLVDELEFLQKAVKAVTELKHKGFLTDSARIEKAINPKSRDAEGIIFIKDGTSRIVAKTFKNTKGFIQEHKNLTAGLTYIKRLDEFRKTSKDILPIIVYPKGGVVLESTGVGIVLLDLAKGNPVLDYIDDIPNMSENDIKNIFSKMGEQFGSIDNLMYKNYGRILFNPDSHAMNFFYDELNNQVYWIDTAGGKKGLHLATDEDKFKHNEDGLEKLNFYKNQLIATILKKYNVKLWETDPVENWKENSDKISSNCNTIKKYLKASQAFAQGYYNNNTHPSVIEFHNKYQSESLYLPRVIAGINNLIDQEKLPLQKLNIEEDYDIKPLQLSPKEEAESTLPKANH